jgi:ribosome biogenesis GTPase A
MRTAVRTSFESDLKINWFPGHMSKTLNELAAQRLKQAHVVVEVRDARIPFSSANRRLDKMLEANKPRFVVLNKCDLAGLESSSRLARDLVKEIKRRSRCTDVVFTHATCDQQGGSGVGFLLKRVASNLPGRFKTTPKSTQRWEEEVTDC